MRIAVIDGQGGGVGRVIIDRLRRELGEQLEILALGTNALATAAMLKAGANDGATGENAIIYNVERVDYVAGSVSIIAANTMLGELTPQMAVAIAGCRARKLLLPIHRSNWDLIGCSNEPLPHLVEGLVEHVRQRMEECKHV